MTEILPFPENNYETVLLDRPFGVVFLFALASAAPANNAKILLVREHPSLPPWGSWQKIGSSEPIF